MGHWRQPFEIPDITGLTADLIAINQIAPLIMRRGEAWFPARSTTQAPSPADVARWPSSVVLDKDRTAEWREPEWRRFI